MSLLNITLCKKSIMLALAASSIGVSVSASAKLKPFYSNDMEKCGYKTESGKVVLPMRYSHCGDLSEGLAVIRKNYDEGMGVMNSSAKLVIPYQYHWIKDYSEGLAIFEKDGLEGAIDKQGNIVIKPQYQYLAPFSEGVAWFTPVKDDYRSDSVYGFIDTSGKMVLPAVFSGAMSFKYGRAAVKVGQNEEERWGIIDKKGNFIVAPEYDYAYIEGGGDSELFVGGEYVDGKMDFYNYNNDESGTKITVDVNGKVIGQKHYDNFYDIHEEAYQNSLKAR